MDKALALCQYTEWKKIFDDNWNKNKDNSDNDYTPTNNN